MKIPTKISPDLLKDSILELRFEKNGFFELIIGQLYTKLNEIGFEYTPNHVQQGVGGSPQQGGLSINTLQPKFTRDKEVTVQLTENSVILNCLNGYIGWTKYSSFVDEILTIVYDLGFIKKLLRIGLRFINVLENTNIYEKLLIEEVRIDIPEYETNSTSFFTVVILGDLKANLRVQNDVKLVDQENSVSLIDIDVYYLKEDIGIEKDEVKWLIEKAHEEEKKLFFTLLRETYVKDELNPVYE